MNSESRNYIYAFKKWILIGLFYDNYTYKFSLGYKQMKQ